MQGIARDKEGTAVASARPRQQTLGIRWPPPAPPPCFRSTPCHLSSWKVRSHMTVHLPALLAGIAVCPLLLSAAPTRSATRAQTVIPARGCCTRTRIASIPYVISSPGSYVVTRNLVAVGSGDGITVAASDVTIDLQGFVLDGATLGGNGILAVAGMRNFTVVNGSIRRWSASGIEAMQVEGGLFKDLHVSDNALLPDTAGLAMGTSAVAEDCTLVSNGTYGLRGKTNSVVTNCAVAGTNGVGIRVDARSTVRGCNVLRSLGAGIRAAGGSTIADNDLIENAGNGIEFLFDGGRGRIEGNNLSTNGGAGIFVDPSLTAVTVVRNFATGNSPNHDVPAISGFAPVGTPNSTTNPWANLQY